MFKWFKKKKSIDQQREEVEQAKDVLYDKLSDMKSRYKRLRSDMKRSFKKGETPSAPKQINLKRAEILRDVTQGLYDTLDGISEELATAKIYEDLKLDKLEGLVKNFDSVFKTNNDTLKTLLKQQEKYVDKMENIVRGQEDRLESMSDMVQDYGFEISEDITIDLLKDFAQEDPEFVKELPDKFKDALDKRT